MYAYLRGTVERKTPVGVELDVNGIGYFVFVPVSTHSKLPADGGPVKLFTHLHVRDEALDLYGFLTLEEKQLFIMLLSVNGVGPRVALAVLSGMTPAKFRSAVLANDVKELTKISGIGKKTAQRIILEIRGRFGEEAELAGVLEEDGKASVDNDVIRALVALGCTPSQARNAAKKARGQTPDGTGVEEQIKVALTHI